jgi:beta-glucanase (GH16 family)
MYRVLIALAVLLLPAPKLGAQPPTGNWKLAFAEECSGSTVDSTKWIVESTDPANATHGSQGLLSTRLAENIVLRDGICHLTTKSEERSKGFPWTTASMWTRSFTQQYGYFEARIRYGGASGLNNAFWLDAASPKPVHFEIDVNEGHYPSQVNMTVHNWSNGHTQRGSRFIAQDDLSHGFHVYGLLWTPQRLTWFMDGIPTHSEPSPEVRGEMKLLLSTAVLPWAGEIGDRLNGTSMDVDWVRAYQAVPQE